MKRLIVALSVLLPSIAVTQSVAPSVVESELVGRAQASHAVKLLGSSTFTNGAYFGRFQSLLGGADPSDLYTSQQRGQQATEALVGAINVPFEARVHQTNAIAGYIVSHRAQPGSGGDVAGYFQAGCSVSKCAIFPLNPLAYDSATNTGQILSNEFDFNRSATDTQVNGINLVLNSVGSPTGTANGFACRTVFGVGKWNNCNVVADGAASQYSYLIGATSNAGNSDTQPIGLVSYGARAVRYIATILGDRFGGLDLRPGVAGGSIALQDYAGSKNMASVNRSAFAMGVPVILQNYTVSTLPRCIRELRGGLAYVTDATAPTYNGALRGGGAIGVPVACDGARWTSH